MTLKACCSNIYAVVKRQIWLLALWFAALFFALPVQTALMLQSMRNYLPQPMQYSLYDFPARVAEELAAVFGPQSIILCWLLMLMAFISALVYGGYMHKQKQADFYHSQPISRARLLLQNTASGLLTVLIPYAANLLLTVIVALAMGAGAFFPWAALFSGLAIHILYFTAIFATSLLAVVISGKGVIAAVSGVFMLSIFPALLGLGLAASHEFYPTFYSALYDWSLIVRWLAPVAAYVSISISGPPYGLLPIIIYDALALTAALLLYRRRGSEAAGGSIAFKTARPLLKYALACLTASLFAWVFYGVSSGYFWLYFGAITGAFLATQITEIVYAFDFRAVLRHLRGLAIFLVFYLALLTGAITDITGFNAAVPQAEEVASARIYLSGVNSYTRNGTGYMYWGYPEDAEQHALKRSEQDMLDTGPVTSPQAVAAAVNIAARYANFYLPQDQRQPAVSEAQRAVWQQQGLQYLLDYLEAEQGGYGYGYNDFNHTGCRVVFTLKNGRTIARDYFQNGQQVQFLLPDIAAIYGQDDFRAAQLNALMFADGHYVPQALEIFEQYYQQPTLESLNAAARSRLLAALRADLLELTVEEQQHSMPIGALSLRLYGGPVEYPLEKGLMEQNSRPNRLQTWPIYASFSRTLAFCAEAGYGPELWQPQLADIISVNLRDTYNDRYSAEKYGYAYDSMLPQAVYEYPDHITDVGRDEITDPARIAEIISGSYPYQTAQYNCFIDIDRRLEAEVRYRGPGGQTYTLTRIFAYK